MKEDYKAAMSLGAVLMMLIATGAMASGQQSMSTIDSNYIYSTVIVLCSL